MNTPEEIAAYYRHPMVRSRIAEYCVDRALASVRYDGVFMLEVTAEGAVESCLAGLESWRRSHHE